MKRPLSVTWPPPPSGDLIQAPYQQATRLWWAGRHRFELFASRAVVAEATRGNAIAAARRLEALQGIPNLQFSRDVTALVRRLMQSGALPPKVRMDAAHVAVAAATAVGAGAAGTATAALTTDGNEAGAIEGAEKLPVRPAFDHESNGAAKLTGEARAWTETAAAEPPTGALTVLTATTCAQTWGATEPWISAKARKAATARIVRETFLITLL